MIKFHSLVQTIWVQGITSLYKAGLRRDAFNLDCSSTHMICIKVT